MAAFRKMTALLDDTLLFRENLSPCSFEKILHLSLSGAIILFELNSEMGSWREAG